MQATTMKDIPASQQENKLHAHHRDGLLTRLFLYLIKRKKHKANIKLSFKEYGIKIHYP